ncbi:MAG: N-acetylmuramoyl-L-alanine amidase [bacterium]
MTSRSLPSRVVIALVAIAMLSALRLESARAAESNAQPLRFRYPNGTSELVATRTSEGETMISLPDVSRLFASTMEWRSDFFQMELPVEGRKVRLTLGSPVALVDGGAIHLPIAVQIVDGVLWAPLCLLTDNLIPLAPNRAQWVAARNEVRVGGADANITRLRTDVARDGVSIEVETAIPLDAIVALTGARAVSITLRGAVIPADDIAIDDRRQMIESVEMIGTDDGGTLAIRLAYEFESASVVSRVNPPRCVVHLGVRSDSTAVADADRSRDDDRDPEAREDGAEDRTGSSEIRTLIIDPGHGGADRGCSGVSGAAEKELTLALAHALRERAEQRLGLRTILTRESDETVASERRATIANTSDGDLLLSIHCNAASDPSANGIEIYLCDSTERGAGGSGASANGGAYASAAAAREDLVATDGDLRVLAWRTAHTPFLEESRRFADALGRGLRDSQSFHVRGVRRGSFAALEGARMPAVQIEAGFLTHTGDEAALSSNDVRAKLADAIVTGIEEYMNEPTP